MQDLFSKVSTEKRHLYGENGILGHRRAVSTTVPNKSVSCGHRRTYSNTSSDFKAIFVTNPALLQQIERTAPVPPVVPQAKPTSNFPKFLNKAYDYFILSILPPRLITPREKLKSTIRILTTSISKLQKTQLQMINTKNDLKGKLKQEQDLTKNSDSVLNKYKKRTNDLELALKKTQEELKAEKNRYSLLMKEGLKESSNKSLSIDTDEIFMFQKVTPKSLYIKSPNLPLTPTSK